MSRASSEMAWAAGPRGDPRASDVGAVRALLDRTATDGADTVRLPAMTAAELCVLGAMTSTLIDAAAWSWWTSAPASRRPELRAAAWRFLASRQLISADAARGAGLSEAEAVQVAPMAALVVAARIRPAFVVLCRAGAGGEPARTRMYGIADVRQGLRAVLIEKAGIGQAGWAGPVYEYQLGSPAAAGRVLANWALGPPLAPAAKDWPRRVDVHLPGTSDIRPARRITVQADGECFRALAEPRWLYVTNQLPCDEDVLASLLTDTLTGACP
jgi:hypothetical protein